MKIFVGYKKYHVEKGELNMFLLSILKKKKLAPICDRSRVAVADFGSLPLHHSDFCYMKLYVVQYN